MTLQSVIDDWGSTYTVTRTTAGTPTDGVYANGTTSTLSIEASIQPVTGDVLKSLPEGQHVESTRVVYTTSELKSNSAGYDPDRITIDGEVFEVFQVEKFSAPGFGTHYRALISRMVTA